jgi:hypothetical protein
MSHPHHLIDMSNPPAHEVSVEHAGGDPSAGVVGVGPQPLEQVVHP